MDELEQRLRSTLTSMAEEVSPSHRAWDEQQRRLALKSRRHRFRPFVMAAVAAAAAVLIAVPVVIVQRSNTPADPAALPEASSPPARTTPPTTGNPPAPSSTLPGYVATHGETLLIQPVSVTSKPVDAAAGTFLSTYVYVIEFTPGDRRMCLAQAMQGSPINGPDQLTYGEPDCVGIHPPKAGQYEWGLRLVPPKFLSNGTKGVWLYVMNRPAYKMLVSKAETGELIPATLKEFGKDIVLFGVYLDSTREAKAYTLYDEKNQSFFNGT